MLQERKRKSGQIRHLLLIILIIIIAGLIYWQNRKPSTPVTVATQQVQVSPTNQPTPNRALKPNEQFIAASAMYILVPEDLNFRVEKLPEDPGKPVTASFFIEKGDPESPDYQLYSIHQAKNVMEKILEQVKTEMDPATVQEVTVGGYKGIEGLVTGPKARYVTLIIKDGKMINFSTYPSTPENKQITDQILSTISFQ